MNGGISQHPVDRLIRELIESQRSATVREVGAILRRMAAAPFNPRPVSVPFEERSLRYGNYRLEPCVPSSTYHLVKRVVVERQWAEGTTMNEYLADLRRAVAAEGADLGVYRRRGGHIAVTLSPTAAVIPSARLGSEPRPIVLVVYSADRSMILTGYQVSTLDQTGIPLECRWLR